MPYSELIKNFQCVRDYMREFYVYGFKSRGEYTKKSARSYDDERRRIDSWLGDYLCFRQRADGKTVFLSVDSRAVRVNPFFRAWKAKSFTDGDITLHFLIFDLLYDPKVELSLNALTDGVDSLLSAFDPPKEFDSSTIRKKLKEYEDVGLILSRKVGKTAFYRRAPSPEYTCDDALGFFSEVSPCGVIGSFLLDKLGRPSEHISYKHHYISSALEGEILCSLFDAMREKRFVRLTSASRRRARATEQTAVPLRVYVSVQNGRQYLMAYIPAGKRFFAFRLDYLLAVQTGELCAEYDEYKAAFERIKGRLWGVSTKGSASKPERVEFTLRISEGEEYIYRRLLREKRCGNVEGLDAHTARFSADVYDSGELVPWIRTFICRISDLRFSNARLQKEFEADLNAMYALYGLSGGEAE